MRLQIPDPIVEVVDRPTPQLRDALPPALVAALEATAHSGKAIRIDVSAWAPNVANALYRRVLALNSDTGYRYTVHGRRQEKEQFFWVSPRRKRAAPRRKKTSA